jgi:hypothetical protein
MELAIINCQAHQILLIILNKNLFVLIRNRLSALIIKLLKESSNFGQKILMTCLKTLKN